MPKLIDTTLREGMQTRDVNFDPASGVAIAKLLCAVGIDMIECAHPSASLSEKTRVHAITSAGLSVPVLAHARAIESDIDAVAAIGAAWVGIFIGINDVSRRTRVPNRNVNDILKYVKSSVQHAREIGLLCRLTVEDSSRTPVTLLHKAYDAALDAGANRICFADTVGILEPHELTMSISSLRKRYPAVDIEVHLHDDRGLAMANALAAIDAGANWVACSINGLGERCGITDTGVLLVNLHFRGTRLLPDGRDLTTLSALVASLADSPVDDRRPVFGRRAFTHTAALHVKAMTRDLAAYEWLSPSLVGRSHDIPRQPDRRRHRIKDE